jgi:hypothetical protein
MKKGVKILLCVLIILLAAAAVVCVWQWDNLMAVKTSLSTSREDIEDRVKQNDEKIAQAVQDVDGVNARDLTDEEKEALRRGDLDRDALLDALTGETAASAAPEVSPAPDSSFAPEPSAAPAESQQPESEESANEKLLSRYLAEIYVMKAEYTAWLEDTYNQAIDEYNALDEDQRTTSAKYSIGMSCMKEALAKEKECDARMAEIEEKITALLKEMGRDTSLVDEIQSAYEEEKSLKKAYYLGLHS